MKKLIIIFMVIPCITLAQESLNKSVKWRGLALAEFVPKLYSDWQTTLIGAQLSGDYKFSKSLFSSVGGNIYFIPTTKTNSLDYSAFRSGFIAFSLQPYNIIDNNYILTLGLSYADSKISDEVKNYPAGYAQIKYYKSLNESITLFANISGVYDFSNKNITPSLKIGFIAGFIVLSFDFSQYLNWDNTVSRINNTLVVPHITN